MTRSALALTALGVALLVPGVARSAQPVPVSYHAWATASDFNAGTYAGTTAAAAGGITLASTGTTNVTYSDPRSGDIAAVAGTWMSQAFSPGLSFTELVSSWNADTPPATWLQVEMRGVISKATTTKWYVLGRWAYGEDTILRTSVGGQGDAMDSSRSTPSSRRIIRSRVPAAGDAGPDAVHTAKPRSSPRCSRLGYTEPEPASPRRLGGATPSRWPFRRLAGDPRPPVPAVGRRRRGVVQPDVDRDGASSSGARARPPTTWPGSIPSYADPQRGLRRALHLRRCTTAAPATGRSTPLTPHASAWRRSSPSCARSPRPSRSSRRHPGRRLDPGAARAELDGFLFSAVPTATWWWSLASTPRATRSSTTRQRARTRGAARLRSRQFERVLAARLGRDRLRDEACISAVASFFRGATGNSNLGCLAPTGARHLSSGHEPDRPRAAPGRDRPRRGHGMAPSGRARRLCRQDHAAPERQGHAAEVPFARCPGRAG